MVEINRVAKVVKGGRRFSFTALVVVGDEIDRVGVGYGKAREVPLAISKAVEDAKKNLFTVPKHGQTITHQVLGRFGAARVLLRPASPGTGVIAGGGVRAVLELGGIHDVLAKSLGTSNPINMLKAAEQALRDLRRPEDVARARGKLVSEVLPWSPPAEKVEEPAAAPAPAAWRRRRGRRAEAPAVEETPQSRSRPPPRRRPADRDREGDERWRGLRSPRPAARSGRRRATAARCARSASAASASRASTTRTRCTAGMLRKVRHLVKVEKV